MKVLIAGAGAVGSTLGATLSLGGETLVFAARGAHGRSMAERGLRFTIGGKAASLQPTVAASISSAAALGPFDLVLVSVKGYDTAALALELAEALPPDSVLLSMQNGIGNEALLSQAMPEARVLSGTLTSACWLEAPGEVVAQTRGGAVIESSGEASDPGAAMVESLRRGGMRAETHVSGAEIKWSKLLLNMLGSASTAILGWAPAQVFGDARLFRLEQGAFREAHRVMRAKGLRPIALPDYPVPIFVRAATWLPSPLLFPLLRERLARGRGDRLPGPAADLAAGRDQTEVAWMAGAIAREAAALGLETPINACLDRLVSGIALGQIDPARFRDRPEVLLEAVARRTRGDETLPDPSGNQEE